MWLAGLGEQTFPPSSQPTGCMISVSPAVQSVGEAWFRTVLPLWEPHPKVWTGTHHGGYQPVPRSGGVLHGRRPSGE